MRTAEAGRRSGHYPQLRRWFKSCTRIFCSATKVQESPPAMMKLPRRHP